MPLKLVSDSLLVQAHKQLLQAYHSQAKHIQSLSKLQRRTITSKMVLGGPRFQFAPLKDGTTSSLPPLKGVVFDVDGTLCKPQNYMFAEMRAALNIPKSTDILDHIYALPTAAEQTTAMDSIRAIERHAMTSQEAQPGLSELMSYLDSRGLPKAICTRNFDLPVSHLLSKFLPGSVFSPIITRDFRPPKPDPAGILHIARTWGFVRPEGAGSGAMDAAREERAEAEREMESRGGEVKTEADASGLIMVGDSVDDMTAGRRAGAATVLLVNEANQHLAEDEQVDLVIKNLYDLILVLENGFKSREL